MITYRIMKLVRDKKKGHTATLPHSIFVLIQKPIFSFLEGYLNNEALPAKEYALLTR